MTSRYTIWHDRSVMVYEDKTCEVCAEPMGDGYWVYHARLNVYVHGRCPKDNVCGEDIRMHTVMMHMPKDGIIDGSNGG